MKLKKLYLGLAGLALAGGLNAQEPFKDLTGKSFSALDYKEQVYKYVLKDLNNDKISDIVSVYYDLDGNKNPDCLAVYEIRGGSPSDKAFAVCYSKTEDGVYQDVFIDANSDGILEERLSKIDLKIINKGFKRKQI